MNDNRVSRFHILGDYAVKDCVRYQKRSHDGSDKAEGQPKRKGNKKMKRNCFMAIAMGVALAGCVPDGKVSEVRKSYALSVRFSGLDALCQ